MIPSVLLRVESVNLTRFSVIFQKTRTMEKRSVVVPRNVDAVARQAMNKQLREQRYPLYQWKLQHYLQHQVRVKNHVKHYLV